MNKSLIDEDAKHEKQIHSEQYELQSIIRDVNDGIVALNEEAGLVTPWVNKKIFRARRANWRCYFFPYFLNYDGLHIHRVLPTLKHICDEIKRAVASNADWEWSGIPIKDLQQSFKNINYNK